MAVASRACTARCCSSWPTAFQVALGAGWATLGAGLAQVFSAITLSLIGVLTVYACSMLGFPLLKEVSYTMLLVLCGGVQAQVAGKVIQEWLSGD